MTKVQRVDSAIRRKSTIIGVAVLLCGGCESGLPESDEEADGSQVGSEGLTTTLGDSGGPTTTTSTDSATSTVTTGITTDDGLQCPQRETEKRTGVRIDFEGWDQPLKDWEEAEGPAMAEGIELSYGGNCIYDSQYPTSTGDTELYFRCERNDDSADDSSLVTWDLRVAVQDPVNEQWPLTMGQTIRAVLQWTSQAHHREESTGVVFFEPQSNVPLYLAATGQSVQRLTEAIDPTEFELSNAECSPIEGQALFGLSFRQRLILRKEGQEVASLLDASFGSFVIDSRIYDYRIDVALRHECVNCWYSFDFSWVARK